MKAIYRNKTSGDIFAIETDDGGVVVATCGPLFADGFDPAKLDYDEYWNIEVQTKLADFEKITEDDYLELLHKNGFITDFNQHYLF